MFSLIFLLLVDYDCCVEPCVGDSFDFVYFGLMRSDLNVEKNIV